MRHKHYGHPVEHPKHGNEEKAFRDCNYVYHPTKGWRKINRNPGPGRQKIARLFARANIFLTI